MTSDAKVGLLLGLFFIFVIAFIINGLPRFRSDTNTNELTMTTMANSPNDSYIGSNERKARESFTRRPVRNRNQSAEKAQVQETTRDEGEYRYKRPLSQDSVAVKNEPITTTEDKVRPTASAPNTNRETKVNVPEQVKPEIYVIQAGDNLAKIAQKFYGTEKGNKTINVNRIFEANRRLLKSPDDISVGQKIIIPLLKDEAESVFVGGLFEKIKSTLSGTRSSTPTPAKSRPKPPAARPTKNYIVRAGDSVWRIAEKQLGDKERFREIIKLNALEDEDYLTVGQRLLIPVR
ncbi:MAG: LysM peptidoglycan-binding domain-containing protein [Sedimentisphaerales bacterium]|nr:LysM peptidoglycan-binding domain-containing protein [Sedimentisphaerales bacterium]